MYNATSRGMLSVEDLNALFEQKLSVKLHCGSYKVVRRSYSRQSGSKVYENRLPLSVSIRFEPAGRAAGIDPAPAVSFKGTHSTTDNRNTN